MECPICSQKVTDASPSKARPFCSMRCKAVDLGRWMAEDYTISESLFPGAESDDSNSNEEGATDGKKDLLH